MHRFFVDPGQVHDEKIFIRDENDIHHMSKVLRLRAGEEIEVSDGNGWTYLCEIETLPAPKEKSGEAVLRITDRQAEAAEPPFNATLFQGVPKASKMDLIVQKCVELGACEIVPVFMKRTVVEGKAGGLSKRIDRWQKIADEAAKQSKRGMLPKVGEDISFSEMLEELKNFDLVLFLYEDEKSRTFRRAVEESKASLSEAGCGKPRIAVIVGPEGGFAESEVEDLEAFGIYPVTVGGRILRTETAGFAALSMLIYGLEL